MAAPYTAAVPATAGPAIRRRSCRPERQSREAAEHPRRDPREPPRLRAAVADMALPVPNRGRSRLRPHRPPRATCWKRANCRPRGCWAMTRRPQPHRPPQCRWSPRLQRDLEGFENHQAGRQHRQGSAGLQITADASRGKGAAGQPHQGCRSGVPLPHWRHPPTRRQRATLRIVQNRDRVTWLYVYTYYRSVAFDVRKHEEDPDPQFWGTRSAGGRAIPS